MKTHMTSSLRRLTVNIYPKSRAALSLQTCRRCKHSHASQNIHGSDNAPVFNPKKAVVLSRITRYEFENLRFKVNSENELKTKLENRKSDFRTLVDRHKTHYSCLAHIENSLKANGIETRVVQRPQYNNEVLDWADVVFTAGGDGTFLDAASKVLTTEKPVIGINTDPTRSEGRLCLDKTDFHAMKFDEALKRLLTGNFKWKWRQRIRITMSGVHANDNPIELSDQQLQLLEHRYSEHFTDQEMENLHRPLHVKGYNFIRVLPVRALNEVYVGECLSSRVSYYELSIDGQPGVKQKSSGVTVCTGTGSTSWYFHINRIPTSSVQSILDIANRVGNVNFPVQNEELVQNVTDQFKDSLIYDPSHPYMGYTVRDPIINGVFNVPNPRGHAKNIRIGSRMWDASLVVDGGCSFRFNDGAIATLEMCDEDALRTVDLN